MIGSADLKIKDPAKQRPNTIEAEHHPAQLIAAPELLSGKLAEPSKADLIKPKVALIFKR